MAREERPTLSINEFSGLKTANDAYEVGVEGLIKATNVDITRAGKIRRRKGATQQLAATPSAAWANDRTLLYQQGSTLYSVDKNYSGTSLRSDLTPSNHLAGYQIGNCVYYSNGIETGCIENNVNRELGIPPPTSPSLTAIEYGDLPAGIYQVTVSFLRNDGFESGVCMPAQRIELTQTGGIRVDGQQAPSPEVTHMNFYVTGPNGDTFYYAGQEDVDVMHHILAEPINKTRALKIGNASPPPAFTCIDNFYGKMIYTNNELLFFSEPFAYERVNYMKDYIPFPDAITMVGVVEDGIFVGTTQRTYFLKGTKTDQLSVIPLAGYGAVLNTRSYLDGTVVGSDSTITRKIPAWISTKGMCIGFPDGSMQNATENVVSLPEGVTGASFFRQENGQNHFISVIRS